MDLIVLQETKLKNRIYTSASSGYKVLATEALIAHSDGISILYGTAENFSMEALQSHGEKFVSFQLALGDRRWHIVGCYLDPDDASTIEDVIAAIGKQTWGAALLVVRNFNTDLAAPEGWEQEKGIAAALEEEGL